MSTNIYTVSLDSIASSVCKCSPASTVNNIPGHKIVLKSICIDLVLVSTPDLIWDISVVEPFSSSCDHSAIHFSVSYPVVISDRQNHCFLDFFNADYCSMISIMKDIDWSFLCQNSLSVEMFWSKISNVLHSCIAQFVPRRYQSRKPFSYPMHIRRLLGLKKLWYSKDKVRYKHFARKCQRIHLVSGKQRSQEEKLIIFLFICKFQAYYLSLTPMTIWLSQIMINVLCLMIILPLFLLLMTVCSQNLCLVSLKTNP